MDIEDNRLSSTDINSDSDRDQEEFISLTDVNSDDDSGFILIDCEEDLSKKGETNAVDQLSSPCLSIYKCSTQPVLIRDTKTKDTKNTSLNKNSKNTLIRDKLEYIKTNDIKKTSSNKNCKKPLIMSKRKDFISDSSSDEELPVMDSLRARLARKRQNAIASPFLPEENKEKISEDTSQNTYTDTSNGLCRSPNSTVSDRLSKDGDSPSNFSDSSGDEYEKQPLSSFLSSPNQRSVNELDSVKSNTDISVPTTDSFYKNPVKNSYKRPVGSTDTEVGLTDNGNNVYSVKLKKLASDSKAVSSSVSACQPPQTKARKKRTAEEIEENRRKAEEKKAERERIKQTKEAEKQKRKIERESKKQFSLGSCLKFVKVLVDTHIMNTPGFGAVLFKACEELGVTCQTEQLIIPYTIMWKRVVTECSMSSETQVETIQNEIIEKEVLALVPTTDFVQMVYNFRQRQKGIPVDGVTLRSYLNTIKSHLPDKSVTVVAQGIEQYFRDVKNQDKRQHREAVLSTDPKYVAKNNKQKARMLQVSRVDIEEAVTETQLQTGCCTFMPETQEDVADLVRRFSKAVAERPAKKDRFDPIFSFHEEGSAGVKVDRSGQGLLKVWKQQLLQFKNVSPDVAQALITEYPSPQLLRQAYLKCTTEKEAVRLLENIVVRRGAGVLETTRRIGKELSRRIYTFLTSDDPDLVIK